MKWYSPCIAAYVLALGLLALTGCGTVPEGPERAQIAPERLLEGSGLGIEVEPLPAVDMLAVNDDMRAFIREHVPSGVGDQRKVELILAAILEDGLRLGYNNFLTYTAQEAFYAREGNCMSFTNLFVALAREAGVDVSFQEVNVPPTWSARGDTWMFNLHINALVGLAGREQVIDFNLQDYRRDYHRRRLSDSEAQARYHNNMGVHWMSEGQAGRSLAHFRRAIELRPDTGYFWTNLGTLYRRHGQNLAAESAYLRAVALDDEPVANSNLARLYATLNLHRLEQYYRGRVELFRANNPYYLFHLAEEAYAATDYPKAERLLQGALRRQREDHEFYRLLGLTHLQQGEVWLAAKRFRQAAERADGEALARYNHKLDLLAGL